MYNYLADYYFVKDFLLGHIAAAGCFAAVATGFVSLVDPDGSRDLMSGAVPGLIKIAASYGLLALLMMLPFSLLTSPFTFYAACRLRAGPGVAVSGGAIIGAVESAMMLIFSGGFESPWTRAGLPGDPRSDIMITACGAAAGVGYAWVVWRLCVRPYR